jgi:hypothetical protein
MSIVDAAIADARLRKPRLVVLMGEPGIGKTRLAEESAAHAIDAGFSVAWANCIEGDFAPALWPWAQVMRALGADSTLEIERATAEGVADVARFPVFARVLDTLRDAATERGGLLVVIDDLHWADDDSARLLTFCAVHLRDAPVVYVATCRPREIAAEHLAALVRAGVAVELAGLSPDAVAQLVTALTGTPPGDDVALQLQRRCDGNPLFVRELTRLLEARPHAAPADLPIPGGVRAVLERRLARVPQPVTELLQAAAVLGTTAPLATLSAMVDLSLPSLIEQLEPARAIGVIDIDAEAVAFVHALVRDTVFEGIATTRRIDLHARAAATLERGDGDDRWAAVATHWLRVGSEPARAAHASRRAADQARQRLAFGDAAAHLGRAVTALVESGADEDEVIVVLLDQAEMTRRAGQTATARMLFLDVAARARARDRGDDLARAALGLGAGVAGFEVALHDPEQVALLEEALSPSLTDPALRSLVLARLAVASFYVTPRRHDPLTMAEEAVRTARASGDERAIGYTLSALCDATAGPAHTEARLAHANEIVAIGVRCDPTIELLGRRLRVRALLELGELRAVDAEIVAFERTARPLGQPLYSWYPPLWRGMRALTLGRFDEVEQRIAEASAIGAAAQSENATMLTETLELWRAVFAGETPPEFSRALIDQHADLLFTVASLGASIAFIALHKGRADEAARHYEAFAADGFARVGGDAEELLNLISFADVAIAFAERVRLEALYDRLSPYADRCVVDGIGGAWLGPAHTTLARVAHALDRVDDARAHLDAARSRCARADAPMFSLVIDDLGRRLGLEAHASAPRRTSTPARAARFHLDGGIWHLSWGDEHTALRDAKGLRDLAYLLARPAVEVHVRELAGAGASGGDAGDVIDRRALEQYRRRLRELDADLVEAEDHHDRARAEQMRIEREFLLAELRAAVGLGGRARRAGDPGERARKAVSGRIRQAIDRIENDAPALARHLRNSVKTGTFCVYRPESAVNWQL